jgi:hypothetical protein
MEYAAAFHPDRLKNVVVVSSSAGRYSSFEKIFESAKKKRGQKLTCYHHFHDFLGSVCLISSSSSLNRFAVYSAC